jgi:hypothetical protein
MLYPKNNSAELDRKLFKNPTSEYRGTPFWAWNCQLTPDLLKRQIEHLKKMGFGGFHMHSRTGMATPYLSDEFMELVKECVEKARDENMLAWLYDEDRWPSGAAGGHVTKNVEYRARHLLFTPQPYDITQNIQGNSISASVGQRMENGRLLAKYNVELDEYGNLKEYRMLADDETGDNMWYAYLEISGESAWYNNQTYVNTLDKKAIDEFIRITYEAYKKSVGEDFGGVVPAIFTDEPQFTRKTTLDYAQEKRDVFLPWTDDLPNTYFEAYNDDLLPHLPELIWNLPNNQVSLTRYRYHDHIAQRFAEAFSYNCGEWCRENNLMLTGHMMEEPTLHSQTAALGEAMRSYPGFDLPGIDILCDHREYTTAKQAQSAVHQYGCEGMLSELYGVTNWDFDFRGHKLQGDWQAALGVTVRVPHLSWVSMEGEAKRDYPASISYQSPWYEEYPLIEDHFARVNTAMTRGKPFVNVGVIHPIESYWLHWGPNENTADIRNQMENNFSNITGWLIFNHIDFNFISESLLPQQCEKGGAPLKVGAMQYDTIIIPGCQTLRSTTVERLQPFLEQGGRIIVMGDKPKFIDASPQDGALDFLKSAKCIQFEKYALLKELEPIREIDIRTDNGSRAEHLITQMRLDGQTRWLFIANGRKPNTHDISQPCRIRIHLKGQWIPKLYDTMTGEISELDAVYEGNNTIIQHTLYTHDSLLLHLEKGIRSAMTPTTKPAYAVANNEGFISKVPIELSEPNVMLLDIAEYAFDDGEYQSQEEILRIGALFRQKLGMPVEMTQPWVIPPEKPKHSVRLRFTITSEIELNDVLLALENAEQTSIKLNGEAVANSSTGWYVDESIKTVKLPKIVKGKNILELRIPFGRRSSLEWCYLLGDFGVKVNGFEKRLTNPVRELSFGDVVPQGLPFYGGNIMYKLTVTGDGRDVIVHAPFYRGGLIGVTLDGKRIGSIVFDPYTIKIPNLSKGEHEIGLILFGNRFNSFGSVHNCDKTLTWFGPESWRTTGDRWSYEYNLKKMGILKSPCISYI